MIKNKLPVFLWIVVVLSSCTQIRHEGHSSTYSVNTIEMEWPENAEDVRFRFNLIDERTNEKVVWRELSKDHVDVLSDGEYLTVKDLSRLPNSGGIIPDNILVSLLVDKSIRLDDMDKVRSAVTKFVDALPENTVYISFFDEQLRSTKRITRDNFDDFTDEFSISTNYKLLFDAALKKFRELSGEKASITDPTLIEKIDNVEITHYLVLLTDGRVDENNLRTADDIQKFSEYVQLLDMDPNNKRRVEIHAVRFGEEEEDVDQTLSYLCVDLRNHDVRGGLYISDPEAFIEKLKISDKRYPDYELAVLFREGKIHYGAEKEMMIRINYEENNAVGMKDYAVGTLLRPVKQGSHNLWSLLWGFLLWAALLGITFLVVQILIPFLRVYITDFDRRYVRKYSFEKDTAHDCHYCLNEIKDGEEIVTKCKHIVHKHCWVENGCQCADYGKHCKTGKQFLFDSQKVFSRENRLYFMPHILYGMTGGFIAWFIFQMTNFWFPHLFESFATYLLAKFYPGYGDSPFFFLQQVYLLKINAFLCTGILLGLISVFILAYIDKSKQRNVSLLWVIIKTILGCIAGFLTFLIGAILITSNEMGVNNFFADSIPWLLSGCVWGLCLSPRSGVVWKYIVIGGITAGLLGFVVLFTGKWWGNYGVLLGFMVASAALGVVFVNSRRIALRYFLKFTGKTSVKVAIHKWMSVAGGSREVTIGKSKDCTICMDWDDHQSLRDVNVKLYVDRKDKIPCLKVMDEHIVYNWTVAKKNDEFLLKNGAKFKLGNTVFRYIEKS